MSPAEPSDNAIAELAHAFRCPKCRSQQGHARRITLSDSKISTFFLRTPGEYAFMSCTLCGYTEIYDLAVYVAKAAGEPVAAEADTSAVQRA